MKSWQYSWINFARHQEEFKKVDVPEKGDSKNEFLKDLKKLF